MSTFPGSVHTDAHEALSTARIQTTDATPAVLWSMHVPTSSVLAVNALVVGESTTGAAQVVYELSAVFTRTSSGNATKETPSTDWATPYFESNTALSTTAAWAADTSSQTARLSVTGHAATTYNWRCVVKYLLG